MSGAKDSHLPVCVVTGASRGLGSALCAEFSHRGFRVAGLSRTASGKVSESLSMHDSVDVRNERRTREFADHVVSRLGRIDIWVNNAAVMDVFRVVDGDVARWNRLLGTNLLGVVNGSSVFAEHVRGRPGGGVLVNLTAGSARTARPGWAAYAASKAAVERLTEALAAEEREAGLSAFCVSPGAMDTDMQRSLWDLPESEFPEGREMRERAAGGRIGDCRDIARRVAERAAEQLRPEAPAPEPVFLPYRAS